ncbi:MAG TPA: HypC/HybG/HupF family hydrogenase formation chaperone [Segeticoccus sp.]|uniref:HypC/HybG/HupF family hydrogenase formation chaperone n=1 Tax=Segeticoccus sp. TaxID=2706531 RepID=UPI002D7FF9B3|nr:HypC/HybG/HupF family hydrogenase formation chaperone [Segeticoccus sp.]HET8601357.1 HypC/HybG/HupF family hydrogenase formation chaperone [Segeticoccus sp.]
MCLAIPAEVVERPTSNADRNAVVDMLGVRQQVDTSLLDGPPQPGEWVLVHVGFAMTRVDEAEARETLAMLGELQQLDLKELA